MLYFNQHLAIYLLGVSDSAKVNTVFFFFFKNKMEYSLAKRVWE